jgi:uncharacterized membrane protein
MTLQKSHKTLRRLGFIALFTMVTIIHFLVTFVVTLFVVSTLNILNRNIFHLENIEFFEIAGTVIIFIISIRIFVTSFKKISLFIKNNFFPDLLS